MSMMDSDFASDERFERQTAALHAQGIRQCADCMDWFPQTTLSRCFGDVSSSDPDGAAYCRVDHPVLCPACYRSTHLLHEDSHTGNQAREEARNG